MFELGVEHLDQLILGSFILISLLDSFFILTQSNQSLDFQA